MLFTKRGLVASAFALIASCAAPGMLRAQTPPRPVPPASLVTRADLDRAVADLRNEITSGNYATKAEVAEIRAHLERLRPRLDALKARLGVVTSTPATAPKPMTPPSPR